MLASVEGIYHHGRVELREQPASVPDETPVIVTFLGPDGVDLRAHGIDAAQAAELSARLAPLRRGLGEPRNGRLRPLRCRQVQTVNGAT